MHEITVYHKDFKKESKVDFSKDISVPFIPRTGDMLIIEEEEYEVKSVVIDVDNNELRFYLI